MKTNDQSWRNLSGAARGHGGGPPLPEGAPYGFHSRVLARVRGRQGVPPAQANGANVATGATGASGLTGRNGAGLSREAATDVLVQALARTAQPAPSAPPAEAPERPGRRPLPPAGRVRRRRRAAHRRRRRTMTRAGAPSAPASRSASVWWPGQGRGT